uniref:Apple domain-containing protein n=1 Tax=Magallana gigas TaxID=29159 RepID=A0A8W8NER6_MAGGI
MSIIVVALLAICYNGVLADLRNTYYKKSRVRSNVLPVSDLDVLNGRFTRVNCASLCREETLCQTFFYQSDDKQCSLYNYPLLENTPVYANSGVAVYETIGCPNSDFVYFGEAGICLKYFLSTTDLYTDASAVCQQEGGEMISLDTNKKIDALAFYISHCLYQLDFAVPRDGLGAMVNQWCPNSDFVYFGEAGVCLKIFTSTTNLYTDASAVCQQEVGPNAGTPVAIGLHSTSSIWTWSNGEPVSFNHTYVKTLINDYDSEVHPCFDNYCGVLRVYSTVDIRIFDRCCINIPNLLVCSMFSLL